MFTPASVFEMRAQIGSEYIFLVSLVFVVVATSILQTFKDTEINMALSSARLACAEMASKNSSLQCYVLGYSLAADSPMVNITPQLSSTYSAYNQSELRSLSLEKMAEVFRPDNVTAVGNCTNAAYYSYCVMFS